MTTTPSQHHYDDTPTTLQRQGRYYNKRILQRQHRKNSKRSVEQRRLPLQISSFLLSPSLLLSFLSTTEGRLSVTTARSRRRGTTTTTTPRSLLLCFSSGCSAHRREMRSASTLFFPSPFLFPFNSFSMKLRSHQRDGRKGVFFEDNDEREREREGRQALERPHAR